MCDLTPGQESRRLGKSCGAARPGADRVSFPSAGALANKGISQGEAAVAAARVDAKKLTVLRATDAEAATHEKVLDAIDKTAKDKGGSLWRRLGSG